MAPSNESANGTIRIVLRALILLCLIGAGTVSYLRWQMEVGQADTLEVYSHLPEFDLVERSGETVGREDLSGKVWVANFFFSYCGVRCPDMNQELAELQSEIEDPDFRLVSFTADPDRDTPETLREYAETYGAGNRWYFLTGEIVELYSLAQNEFRLPIAQGNEDLDPTHSPRFILVDRKGHIRGYYESDNPHALKKLRRDIRLLLAERGEQG